MRWLGTRQVQLACGRCGSPIGRALHRALPARLDVGDVAGAALAGERAGRVLQYLDAGGSGGRPVDPDLRRWLDRNAIELVYEFDCPVDGRVIGRAADIAGAIRRSDADSGWVQVPVRAR